MAACMQQGEALLLLLLYHHLQQAWFLPQTEKSLFSKFVTWDMHCCFAAHTHAGRGKEHLSPSCGLLALHTG